MDNLRTLPKIRDSISYVYIEHRRIDRYHQSIAVWDETNGGYTPVPSAALCVLMLGPGTTITQAAIHALADNNCLVIWCGEENVRFYAFGAGGTRSATPLILQARLVSDENTRLEVVKRMYRMRFDEWPSDGETLTIEQLRGMEGARMRAAYADASRRSGVAWDGRNYDRSDWGSASDVNRALSAANQCLYGVCHAALLATGYSPGLGFIHCGKQLSFVYDVADLYKTRISIPAAFQVAGEAAFDPDLNVERAARLRCRDLFRQTKFLQRVVDDIKKLFGGKDLPSGDDLAGGLAADDDIPDFDGDMALPGSLWAPQSEGGAVHGGTSYGSEFEEADGDESLDDTFLGDAPTARGGDALTSLSGGSPPNAPGIPATGSIEDLFRPSPAEPPAPKAPAPRPKRAAARAAATTKAPPKSAPTTPVELLQPARVPPALDGGPFGPDPGCEAPPWGDGPSPQERLEHAAAVARAAAASASAQAANPTPAPKPGPSPDPSSEEH